MLIGGIRKARKIRASEVSPMGGEGRDAAPIECRPKLAGSAFR